MRVLRSTFLVILAVVVWETAAAAEDVVERPFVGVEHISRTEASPRPLRIHVVRIDLTAPGIRFKLTPQSGTRGTVRQTTLDFLEREGAQIAINGHFFLPFPSADTEAWLVGFAASDGVVYSGCEAPDQSYAIVTAAPAININANRASVVHCDPASEDGKRILEPAIIGTALAGSAQIVTHGVKTIPEYAGPRNPGGLLKPGGPGNYSAEKSWYGQFAARTAIGLSQDGRTLVLFTVDGRGAGGGMSVDEVADMLMRDFGVYDALNLDGGGSTTLAMTDAAGKASVVNRPSEDAQGRAVGSNLAVFANPAPLADR
jgi:exopolysaccharide biosynthesis protein